MTSIQEFIKYLRTAGLYSLSKAEASLKSLSIRQVAEWNGLKLSLSHFLNTLYYEMFDCKIGLEQEIKKTGSKAGKVLIGDLKKDMGIVLALREEVLATGSFTNQELFELTRKKFLLKIKNLREVLKDYLEELEIFEQKLMSALVLLKRADDFILQAPELIGKIRLEIGALKIDTFLSQKEKIAASIEDLSQQIKDQDEGLSKLKEISGLEKVLATLELVRINLVTLAKTVGKTDPKVWGQSTPRFDLFKKNLLRDMEGSLKILAGAAEDIEEVQKQLAI
ncbi:MAG: hypothetical protein Q7S55_00600 [Nanoarchaeota archaeon]|nr:hypothetical protein [Nanoarchaeota archaeon]